MKRKGIAVAGSLIADTIYSVETYPKLGRLTKILSSNQYVGGSCNLILDLAKLDPDLPVKVSGIVGNDSAGIFIKETLQSFPNVVITAHQAFFTENALQDISQTTIANLTDFEQGKPLEHEVKAV